MNAPFTPPPTDRALRWLRHIAVHGPQSSEFLLELCADTHRCRDTGLRALQKLRETGYLRLPAQQCQIAKADFNPYVYDLTVEATLYLRGLGDPTPVRPVGHWWHSLVVASLTSAIAITAARRGYRYIPAHEILTQSGAALAIPMSGGRLIPDQLFAIDYGGRFRSFLLEVDRGTEPLQSNAAKKSMASMLAAYDRVIASGFAQEHYRLKSPLLPLFAFTNPSRAARCLAQIAKIGSTLARHALTVHVPSGFPRWPALQSLATANWERPGQRPFCIL